MGRSQGPFVTYQAESSRSVLAYASFTTLAKWNSFISSTQLDSLLHAILINTSPWWRCYQHRQIPPSTTTTHIITHHNPLVTCLAETSLQITTNPSPLLHSDNRIGIIPRESTNNINPLGRGGCSTSQTNEVSHLA